MLASSTKHWMPNLQSEIGDAAVVAHQQHVQHCHRPSSCDAVDNGRVRSPVATPPSPPNQQSNDAPSPPLVLPIPTSINIECEDDEVSRDSTWFVGMSVSGDVGGGIFDQEQPQTQGYKQRRQSDVSGLSYPTAFLAGEEFDDDEGDEEETFFQTEHIQEEEDEHQEDEQCSQPRGEPTYQVQLTKTKLSSRSDSMISVQSSHPSHNKSNHDNEEEVSHQYISQIIELKMKLAMEQAEKDEINLRLKRMTLERDQLQSQLFSVTNIKKDKNSRSHNTSATIGTDALSIDSIACENDHLRSSYRTYMEKLGIV
jgi:hypothetical protein|mmetsp:Transcript_15553/g.33599  ORF Transcript_15553/g.33599 Transcript_15553/m.33599 type:complete len:312 (+) Transcript_15553:195-1130(+)